MVNLLPQAVKIFLLHYGVWILKMLDPVKDIEIYMNLRSVQNLDFVKYEVKMIVIINLQDHKKEAHYIMVKAGIADFNYFTVCCVK